MQKASAPKKLRKPQQQRKPGKEKNMVPTPVYDNPGITGNGKLRNKVALITGGDSGIGRAVAVLFAKEGADIAIAYLNEKEDANETSRVINSYGKECLLIRGNLGNEGHCKTVAEKVIKKFGRIDILVNNAGTQFANDDISSITTKELRTTFEVNIFSYFWMAKAVLPYLKKGACIINTSSVTAYRGSAGLMDYAATKGAIVSFTRSLAANLVKKGIRVNGVAPGPVWTPLIVSSFSKKKVSQHGSDAPMGRAAEPVEIAPSYLFLASNDASYITGQFIHPNGGEVVNG
jgi:NAD(P)-dependent dehydrogenase (short-subunit alcohol dehydrogenase family)